MNSENSPGRVESAANSLLPGILLDTYESGDYSSADEVVRDVGEAWDDYREEWDLDEFGELEQEFDVSSRGGLVRDESAVVESDLYRVVVSEDDRGIMEKLRGEDGLEPWSARLYITQHFNGYEHPHKGRFLDTYLVQNFSLDESPAMDRD